MIRELAFYNILGRPFVSYLGFITLAFFILTAFVAISNRRGLHIIPFKWHSKIAIFSITLGIIHGLLIILSN